MKNSSKKIYPLSLCAVSKTLQAVRPLVSGIGKRVFLSSAYKCILCKVIAIYICVLNFQIIGHCNPAIDLSAIKKIESQGCKSPCIGDSGKALGLYQLHYGVIQDYNRAHATKYTHKSALNPITAHLIASWAFDTYYPNILRRIGIRPTTDNLIVCFNAGCGALRHKNLTKTTQNYLKKYKELTT